MAFDGDYSDAPAIYLEHGMEFRPDSKGLNYFLKSKESYEKLAHRLELLQHYRGKVYSLDIDCPLYGTRGRSRDVDAAPACFKGLDWDRIDSVCQAAQPLTHRDIPADTLTIGDSHSVSAWIPGGAIERNDGKTLYGALKLGFDHWLQHYKGLKHLRTYFGNIDIRFHLARQSDPKNSVIKLVNLYVNELCRVRHMHGIEVVEAVQALPIENEARVLPKTGYYKGQPFYGDWKTRNHIREMFNYCLEWQCNVNNLGFVKWPETYTNVAGELDFAYMEKPRSVHISPEFYLWRDNNEAGIDELDFSEAA